MGGCGATQVIRRPVGLAMVKKQIAVHGYSTYPLFRHARPAAYTHTMLSIVPKAMGPHLEEAKISVSKTRPMWLPSFTLSHATV